jgi:hypothetical protein
LLAPNFARKPNMIVTVNFSVPAAGTAPQVRSPSTELTPTIRTHIHRNFERKIIRRGDRREAGNAPSVFSSVARSFRSSNSPLAKPRMTPRRRITRSLCALGAPAMMPLVAVRTSRPLREVRFSTTAMFHSAHHLPCEVILIEGEPFRRCSRCAGLKLDCVSDAGATKPLPLRASCAQPPGIFAEGQKSWSKKTTPECPRLTYPESRTQDKKREPLRQGG